MAPNLTRRAALRAMTGTVASSLTTIALAGCATSRAGRDQRPTDKSRPHDRSGVEAGNALTATANRISLAQWSLHRTLQAGHLDPLDFPVVARSWFGLGGVEYVNRFYRERGGAEQRDVSWLAALRRRAEDSGVRSLLI